MVKFFGYTFFEKIAAMTADKAPGTWKYKKRVFKPKSIAQYYYYYKNYDLIRAPIDDLVEGTVGQGFYTTVEKVTPVLQKSKSKELVDKFSEHFQLDALLPNIVRNMLIAGYCPVETRIKAGPVSKNALKIVHPKTVIAIDEKDGEVVSITQKVDDKEVKIDGKNLAWFVYGKIANDPRGVSIIQSLYDLLNTLIKATDNVDAILDRYIAPLGIWKSRRSISAIKKAATVRNQGEDIFLGMLSEDEMKDGVVDFISIDPRVPFWEYIMYLDRRIYAASRANNIWYLRDATEASARVIVDIINRHIYSIQRNIKRGVEKYWFRKLVEVNGLMEVPKMVFGLEKTGIEDIRVEDFLTKGLEIGYVSQPQYNDLIRQMGLKILKEDDTVPASSEPDGEEEVKMERGE